MKHVIITGSSSGIGQDSARLLARNGFQVHACVRSEKDEAAWAGTDNVFPLRLDVTREEDCASAFEKISKILKPEDELFLVNNAGIAVGGPVESTPMKDWRNQFEVNVFGLIRVTQTFLPLLRTHRGRIVNMSSRSGKIAFPFLGPYCASKHAVEALSDSLRRELWGTVKVVLVEPGSVGTPIWEKGEKQDQANVLPAPLHPVYQKKMTRFAAMVKDAASRSVPVRMVSEIVLKALTLENPKARYPVLSNEGTIQDFLFRWLPTSFLDSKVNQEITKE